MSVPRGRFFVWVCLLLCAFAPDSAVPLDAKINPTQCRSNIFDEKAAIKHVIDGDTVILADDRHIRLIGINAPEIAHDGRPAQAGAAQALKFLQELLPAGTFINLNFDQERQDHYQRTLAHLFLKDGANVQALLLQRGLATMLTIPPNLEFLGCYTASADSARDRRTGLWAHAQYQPVSVALLTPEHLGYRVITGKIIRVARGKTATWLNLSDKMSLRIAPEHLRYFNNLKSLTGANIQAAGVIYMRNGQMRMNIRHPADMKTSEN